MVGHVAIQNLMSGLHQGPVQVEHEEVLHFCALCAVLDEAGPLHPGDYVHVAVLASLCHRVGEGQDKQVV